MANKSKPEHESANRILATAWQLFQQKGYKGVSIDEICSRCNLTKPTLYYYYHNKEGLFVSVLEHQLARFHDILEKPGNTEERLQRMAEAILNNFQIEYTVLIRDRTHVQKPENQNAIKDSFRSNLFNPLREFMAIGLNKGELQGRNPEMLTLTFLGIINNFVKQASESSLSIPLLARDLTHLFLQGASKR